jgi:hypothetical protein
LTRLFVVIGFLCCLTLEAQSADTGWRTTGTINQGVGWAAFTTTSLNTSDNIRAIVTNTNYGVNSDYGFTIPAGATINGIEVQVEGRSAVAGTVNYGVGVSWDTGTSWTTEKTDSYTTTTDATDTFGGATDTWGRTWTVAELANANFQFRIHKISGTPNLEIDFIQIRVFYTAPSISGLVFEDVNYGGGAGRTLASSSGVARQNARVELYDGGGALAAVALTNASGLYAFPVPNGNYTVRVVSSSVTSSRTGYVATLLPIMTFRTNASSGTAVDVTDYVGGHDPATADAGNAAGGWILTPATGVFSGSGSGKAHAFAPVTVSGANVTGVDFGWNFDTIVNTNDSGQGSLRQFINNANMLGGDASLAQSGLVAAKENAVFMVGNGTAAAGLRAANNYFSGGVATIRPATSLPTIGTPIVFNAQKQPGWTLAPIIELDGTNASTASGF